MKRFLGGIFLFLYCISSFSQNIQAKLSLSTDTIVLGKPFSVVLQIQHSKNIQVLFPKQKEDFLPLELIRYVANPPVEKASKIIEEITYSLASFSIDSVQRIQLEYSYLQGEDTLKGTTNIDSAYFASQVFQADENTPFQADTSLEKLKNPTNWVLVILAIVLGLALLVAFIMLLRRPLLAYFHRRSVLKEWWQLQKKFKDLQQPTANQGFVLDELNKMWKDAMDKEQHFQVQLRSLTTSELIPLVQTAPHLSVESKQLLIETAQAGDRAIYAGLPIDAEQLKQLLAGIQQLLEKQFYERMKHRN